VRGIKTFIQHKTESPEAADLAWEQLVHHVINSKDERDKHPAVFAVYEKKAQVDLLLEIHDWFDDEMTLAIKVNSHCSYEDMQTIINFMSKKLGDDGHWYPYETSRFALPLPKFASLDRCKLLKNMIEEEHNFDVDVDTKTVTFNILKTLQQKLIGLGKEWVDTYGIVLQILGDGYRHLRRISIINVAYKVLYGDRFYGSPNALMSACIWEGDEGYDSIKQNCAGMNKIFGDLVKDGIFIDFGDGGDINHYDVRVVAGGDMKWILACVGMSGWLNNIWRLQKSEDFAKFGTNYRIKTTRMAFHLAHAMFDKSDFRQHYVIRNVHAAGAAKIKQLTDGCHVLEINGKSLADLKPNAVRDLLASASSVSLKVVHCIYHHEVTGKSRVITLKKPFGCVIVGEFGMRCPGCHKLFKSWKDLLNSPVVTGHGQTHYGHVREPIFRFVEIWDFFLCVLHQLLQCTGHMWKQLIGTQINSQKKATDVTKFLHDQMHVYIPELDKITAQGQINQARSMHFNGHECLRICSYWEDCLDTACDSAPRRRQIVECMKSFMVYYNILKRPAFKCTPGNMPKPKEIKQLLLAKSKKLATSGRQFADDYLKATNDTKISHYIRAAVSEVPEMSKRVDLCTVSGSCLEALNQQLKSTKTTGGGGGAWEKDEGRNLIARQLAGQRLVLSYLNEKGSYRQTYYQRSKQMKEDAEMVSISSNSNCARIGRGGHSKS